MANEAARAAADQLVIGFDGNAATPVCAERDAGQNSEEQAEDGYHNAKWSPPNWCLPGPKWLAENSWMMKTKPAEPYQGKAGAQTLAIHAGEPKKHGVNTGVGTTISRTSTFTFSSTQEMKEWAEG